ncbi:MAG: OmpA family protein [Myxococcales bacterium]|nr:OmpA family protein [Myxococcales bacterium]MCB9718563.1 OmpA family protein [Myxococcales bacterium]
MRHIRIALVGLALGSIAAGCSPSRKELMAELDDTKAQLEQSQATNQTLEQRIVELEGEIGDRQARIDELEAEAKANEAELAELRAAKAEREKELATYKQLFARLKKLIDAGTIKVVFRKGKMMVAMSSAVLFDSGKAELKEDGIVTLDEITQALQTVGDRDFLVAGHTDNVPIKTRRYRNNWELSTERAVVVVEHMLEQGFPGAHLGAAGYAELDPVASNDTPDGRAQNRRIEIILMPNLGELKGIREMLEGG